MLPYSHGWIIDHPQFADPGHRIRITAFIAIYPGINPGDYQTSGDNYPGYCHISHHPFNIHFNTSKIMKNCIHLLVAMMISVNGFAQVSINSEGLPPDNSAMLDIRSTSKGMLVPRMTIAQRNAISLPATGLLVYCTDSKQYHYNKGTIEAPNWIQLSSQWLSSGNNTYFSSGNVGIGISDPMQALHVNGKILAEYGASTIASYRFGDGSENTGFSSSFVNSISFVNNGVQSANIDGSGRMIIGTGTPVSSAQLEVQSTARGFLPPRMTKTQRDAISSPATGLMIYNTTTGEVNVFNGTFWSNIDGTAADTWRCGQLFKDTRDGKSYSTVQIGTQCWFAENLNVGSRIPGSQDQVSNTTMEKYCMDDLESNCTQYGGLYQWGELMQYATTEGARGLCPNGWHIPTDAEFALLATSLGTASVAGGLMKEAGTTHWTTPNTDATNSSGFTGLPSGTRSSAGTFMFHYSFGYFWSSSKNDASSTWHSKLSYNNATLGWSLNLNDVGCSCRCIKN